MAAVIQLPIVVDINRLQNDLKVAVREHEWVEKSIKDKLSAGGGWVGIPLRTVGGVTGPMGLLNRLEPAAVSDGGTYQDTVVLKACPYFQKIIGELKAKTNVYKIRIMSLSPGAKISAHSDYFTDRRSVRIHIPIQTHPDAEFWIEKSKYYL